MVDILQRFDIDCVLDVGAHYGEFGQFVQKEFEKWAVIVRESGAKAD